MDKKLSMALVLLVFFSMLNITADFALATDSVTIRAPAVSKTSSGYIGAVLYITVSAVPGDGHIYVDTWPLTELDTQASARLAVEVAGRMTGKDVTKYDFYYVVRSESPVIGGPSAGGVMTVATIAALEGWKINNDVMMTGMINPDGTIGPVGGIIEKLDASAKLGIKKFLVPWGQTVITTQETIREENRGMIQIITKPKKVNVVDYAKKNYGIEVIELEDVNDALFYFTGKKFPEKEIKGEIQVNTDFLSEEANKSLQKNIEYHDSIEKELKSAKMGIYEKKYMGRYLDTAQDFIDKAREDMKTGKYYTSLSELFNAEIYIGVVDEYLNADDLDKRLKDLEEKINSVDSELKEKRGEIKGIVSLEFLSAAEKRLKDAYDYLDQARNYVNNYDTLNAVYAIAYADKRCDTVRLWLNLSLKYSQGEKISIDDLKEDAWKRIEEAKLVYVYVSSMVGESSVSDAAQSLNDAQSEYEAGRYTSALFYAIESNIESSITIELSMSGDDPGVIGEKIQRARDDAKVAIQLSREEGYEPMLAECYYEYGENFEEKEDAANAFRMYKYAKEVALAYKHISNPETMPTVVTETPSVSTPLPSTPSSQGTTTSKEGSKFILILGSGLVGLFMGILIGSAFRGK